MLAFGLSGARRNAAQELRRFDAAVRARPATGSLAERRTFLRRSAARILEAFARAADPGPLVARHLKRDGDLVAVADTRHRLARGRIFLVSVGKAAVAMARAAEAILGDAVSAGLVVANAQAGPALRSRVRIAGHPLPDARSRRAASDVLALLAKAQRSDLVIVLLSGGASALLTAPVPGVSLRDKARVTELLLRAGASIQELNTVRKHLSRIKGGGLVRSTRARVVTLVLSDVVGNDLATIGSGPTVPDPTTFADAVAVLRGRGLLQRVPLRARKHLLAGAHGEREETLKPGDPKSRRTSTRIVGDNRIAVRAAAREARQLGFLTRTLTTRLAGEARHAGPRLVSELGALPPGRKAGVCLLASGETTVTVSGQGRGGRNQELVVASARGLATLGTPAMVASLASDGIDGQSDAAGGVADDRSLARARRAGLASPETFLAANDTTGFLAPLSDLIVTGPTGTNVLDLTVLLR